MSVGGEGDERRRADVAVVDRDVPPTGWQQIDLARTLAGLPLAGPAAKPASLHAEAAVLSFPDRASQLLATVSQAVPAPLPASVFVSIGRPAPAVAEGGRRFARRGSANDNVARPETPARSVWRDLFFLAILAATVAGAFWSGRVHGLQNVIVVPGPTGFNTVIT